MNIPYINYTRLEDKKKLFDEDNTISYRELDIKSNIIANRLISKGYGEGSIIAISNMRSIKTICEMIGIMKAGAAYLSLDLSFSSETIRSIMEESKATFLNPPDTFDKQLPSLYLSGNEPIRCEYTERPKVDISLDSVAYVVYTSGTTGKRKGVRITHGNLINYVNALTEGFNITNNDSTIILTDINYDLSYTALYLALSNESEIHFVPAKDYFDTDNIVKMVFEYKISFLKLTPSIIKKLLFSIKEEATHFIDSLRLVFCGGEKIDCNDIELLHRFIPFATIVNHYGPTETTIGCCYKIIDFNNFHLYRLHPTVGKPILGNRIVVVNDKKEVLGCGEKGELVIIGAGVSPLGYISGKGGFSIFDGEHAFFSGDIASIDANGDCEIFGRKDSVYKIRGYKVSISEVDNIINNSNLFEKYELMFLDGHFVVFYTGEKTNGMIRQKLLSSNPSYLVPDCFVYVDYFRYNKNGKLDIEWLKTLLSTPTFVNANISVEAKDILQLANKYVYIPEMDNYLLFDFKQEGMDSLTMVEFLIDIEDKYGIRIPDRVFHHNFTLQALLSLIEEKKEKVVKHKAVIYEIKVEELLTKSSYCNILNGCIERILPFINTQSFYYKSKYMLNSVLIHVSPSNPDPLYLADVYSYFVSNRAAYRAKCSFEDQTLRIMDNKEQVVIPKINVSSLQEIDTLLSHIYTIMSAANCENPTFAMVLYLTEEKKAYLIAFIKHFLLKEESLNELDRLLTTNAYTYAIENDSSLFTKYFDSVQSKISIDYNKIWIKSANNFFEQSELIEDKLYELSQDIYSTCPLSMSYRKISSAGISLSNIIPIAFAKYLSKKWQVQNIPLTIYLNRVKNSEFDKLSIDTTDYVFFLYDNNITVSDNIKKLVAIRESTLTNNVILNNTIGCYNIGLDPYRKKKIYCNVVLGNNENCDEKQKEIVKQFKSCRISTIEGLGIYCIIDSREKNINFSIASNYSSLKNLVLQAESEYKDFFIDVLDELLSI